MHVLSVLYVQHFIKRTKLFVSFCWNILSKDPGPSTVPKARHWAALRRTEEGDGGPGQPLEQAQAGVAGELGGGSREGL